MNRHLTSHSSRRPVAHVDFLSLGVAAKIGRIVNGVGIAGDDLVGECFDAAVEMAEHILGR